MAIAFIDQLTAIRDNLAAELRGESARRAALVAAGKPPPATYQLGKQQVSWTEYYKSMLAALVQANKDVIEAGGDGGLTEEVVQGYV